MLSANQIAVPFGQQCVFDYWMDDYGLLHADKHLRKEVETQFRRVWSGFFRQA